MKHKINESVEKEKIRTSTETEDSNLEITAESELEIWLEASNKCLQSSKEDIDNASNLFHYFSYAQIVLTAISLYSMKSLIGLAHKISSHTEASSYP